MFTGKNKSLKKTILLYRYTFLILLFGITEYYILRYI